MNVSALYIYPVKSLKGISLPEVQVERRGFAWDRRWMITDLEGGFLTQREIPRMGRIETALDADGLVLTDADTFIRIPLVRPAPETRRVVVWEDEVEAEDCGDAVANWLSERLGRACRLVFMPENSIRPIDPDFSVSEQDVVSFADGFPVLITNTASLEDLNARLDQPVSMLRFRPNLVIHSDQPFAEDQFRRLQIGNVPFVSVKPCARCVMTTIDPETGESGKEPLRTLASFRTLNRKVMFGQNLIPLQEGTLRLEMPVVKV